MCIIRHQSLTATFAFYSRLNLFELIKKNNYQGVSMSLIRTFGTSIVQCLRLLSKEGIIHCDLKPVGGDGIIVTKTKKATRV